MERIGEREQRVLGNFLGVGETILIYEIYWRGALLFEHVI